MAYLNGRHISLTPRLTVIEGLKYINKITLESAASKIRFTQNAHGFPLNLKQVVIALKLKPDISNVSADKIALQIKTDDETRFLTYREINTKPIVCALYEGKHINGITGGFLAINGHNDGATLSGQSYLNAYANVSDNIETPIQDIVIGVTAAGAWLSLLEGSTVEIWGC